MRVLAEALGEEYDSQMAEPERIAPVAISERKHSHSNTKASPSTKRVGGWSAELEPWKVALSERVLGRQMKRFGYELSEVEHPGAENLLRSSRLMKRRRAARMKWLREDRHKRLREASPVAARLTSPQRSMALS